VKELKKFIYYILNSKVLVCVTTNYIEDILIHLNNEGRRGKWITKIQDYDMEIKPTKLVKGQGLAKILDESNCKVLGMNELSTNIIEI
jgi:hypothetical protein